MKLVPIFLVMSISICGYSATAFLINRVPLSIDKVLPLPLDNLILLFDPLKMLLKTLGISVEHLVEGLKKCVYELRPQASKAVKKFLVIIICFYFHGRSLC
uniref:secretoglobin family 3A member 2-like n=1 Tax=Arvicanthis niloticus TaxID=61156 RepID=UPI0014861CB9|nr:secretoglobin family 3A member 2-like [Arvicanthis niloticus]